MIIVIKIGFFEIEIDCFCNEFKINWGLILEKIVGCYKVVIGLVGDIVDLDLL